MTRLTDKEREAVEALKGLVEFAYKHGYHELGYDPVKQLVTRLDAPAGGLETVAWRWREFDGIGGSPRDKYHEDCPQGEGRDSRQALVLRSAAEAKIAGIVDLLREAYSSFCVTQNPEDYTSEHWSARARALIETGGGEDENND